MLRVSGLFKVKRVPKMRQNERQNLDNEITNCHDNVGALCATKRKYKCTYDECNVEFLRADRLAAHIRIHTGEKPFKCNHADCDKAYTHSSHLKRHILTHSIAQIKLQCPNCSLMISNRHNLKRHYDRVHKDPSKLACKECDITFSKKYQLKSHINSHLHSEYKCDLCNKKFLNTSRLNRHKASHEKSYPCTVSGCTKVFQKWLLRYKHIKTEHNTKLQCSKCNKSFFDQNGLNSHSKIHLDYRPTISCPYDKCERSYLYKKNLAVHIKYCHSGMKFECDICKVQICSKRKLAAHIQKVHLCKKNTRRYKTVQRKIRIDAGKPKRSMVANLLGVTLPETVEKVLLSRTWHVECDIA